ncbi:DNA polymerase [Bacillus thuringiensis]|uniref:DNA polymerase n=1 Tax=Bacillus thuringiensis TaxID=1428 RepID=UPI000BF34AE8|nr:DNA polymerase [Bacillus thuringiensis]PFS55674.1 DNA polymerase I [Bacillus thuringiensis]
MKLDIKINLAMSDNSEAKRSRSKEVKKKVADANETIQEALQRISKMSLTKKEAAQVEAAIEAVNVGKAGRIKEGKMSKGEACTIGEVFRRQNEAAIRKQRIQDVLDNHPHNFHVLTDDSQLAPFLERLREEVRLQMDQWANRFDMLGVKSLTANDFEGTGIDSFLDLSIGFSIWLPILNEGYYLAYGHVEIEDDSIPSEYAHKDSDPQLTRSKVLATITPYLSNKDHGKSFHMGSARYDLHIAENDGYTINGCIWDSLDAMKIMTESLDRYGLKPLIQRYGSRFLGIHNEVYTFDDLFGARSPAPFNTTIVGIYAIYDVYYGWKLTEWQFETMKKTDRLLDCYALVDSKLPQVDAYLMRSGFHVDLDKLSGLEEEFRAKAEEATQAVYDAYRIDAKFLEAMSYTINSKKIIEWRTKNKKKLDTLDKRLAKIGEDCKKAEADGKTHTKRYADIIERQQKYRGERLALLDVIKNDDHPHKIESFEFTNGNHIGYLIYDHLGIKDRTYKIQKGKKRSTSADVLKMYFEDEPTLKPLATVAEYQTLLNTFVLKIPQVMEVDGRFHSKFDAGGTTTGRYSSAAYNGRPIDILDEFR